MADLSREEILRNAQIAAQVVNDDYSLQDLVDAGIRDKEAKMQRRRAEQRENYGRRAERAGNTDVANELLNSDELRTLGLDKFSFDGGNIEYGVDQADLKTDSVLDKDFSGGRRKREQEFIADMQAEADSREGLFAADVENQYTRNYERPRRNKDPRRDGFVVKADGKPVRFKRGESGRYDTPTTDADGVIKAVMAKRRGAGNKETYSVNREEFETRDSKGDLYYPEASEASPEGGFGGSSNDRDIYQRITQAIDSGSITDPVQLESALRLKSEIKRSIDPQYDRTITFDAGRKVTEQDSARYDSERRVMHDFMHAARSAAPDDVRARLSDVNLGRIGEIVVAESGFSGKKKDFMREVPIEMKVDTSALPQAYVDPASGAYLDRADGSPLYTDEYRYDVQFADQRSDANIPNSGQNNNSPTPGSLQQLVEDQQFRTRTSGTYPQVSIGSELDTFAQRLGKLGALTPEGNLNVRSLAEAEALVGQVLSAGKASGSKFTEFGTKKITSDPTAASVFAKMRYSGPELSRLSNALLQLNFASQNPVNQSRKELYSERVGEYMPQGSSGQPIVDLSNANINGSLRPDIRFDSPEMMDDYAITDRLDFANSRNAPQFRALNGSAELTGSPEEIADTVADARRAFIGQERGVSVPIAGDNSNPNYRFNASGITNPSDIAINIQAQAERRAAASGKKVNQSRIDQNIVNAVSVSDRHIADQSKARFETGPDGKAEREKRLGIMKHIQRDAGARKPYKPADSQQRYYDKSRSTEDLMGVNALGIDRPQAPATEPKSNYSVVDSPINIELPEGFKPKAERENRISNIKTSLGSAYEKYGKGDEYRTGRRVGYGAAGVVGLAGLAGLLNNESDRRKQEAYQ